MSEAIMSKVLKAIMSKIRTRGEHDELTARFFFVLWLLQGGFGSVILATTHFQEHVPLLL